jgi:serine/threonine-protein kinase PRP4
LSPAPPHHRQRNKKHEEKSEREGEDINLPPPVAVNIARLDEDMEEGEILEEEGFGGGEHEIEEKIFDSDDEFGEMKSIGV